MVVVGKAPPKRRRRRRRRRPHAEASRTGGERAPGGTRGHERERQEPTTKASIASRRSERHVGSAPGNDEAERVATVAHSHLRGSRMVRVRRSRHGLRPAR